MRRALPFAALSLSLFASGAGAIASACGGAFVEATEGTAVDSGGGTSPGEQDDGSSVIVGPAPRADAGEAHDGEADALGAGADSSIHDANSDALGTGPGDGCTAEQPDTATGVFVSESSTATMGCGAIGSPCGTISAGVAVANVQGKSLVYIDRGTYDEQVTLADGIALTGGWTYDGTSWSRECAADPSALAIVAPTTAYSSIVLPTGVTTTVSDLAIHTPSTVPAGQSVYGIFASGKGHLTLDSVEVTTSGAGDGAAANGLGAIPSASCNGASDGGTGAPASPGAPAAGAYSSAGYAAGNGGSGGPGNSGQPGTAAGLGRSETGEQCMPGGVAECETGTTTSSGPGNNGCGGPGGAPGLGGGGGGSSIGLFVWGATVELSGGMLSAGRGGNGGSGTTGAAAATSWTGMNGSVGTSGTETTCRIETVLMMQVCTQGMATFVGGTAGGAGGEGSQGGTGADGSGGDSYAYYAGGGAVVTGASSVALSFNSAGTGGAGSISGYAGHAAAHN